VLLRNAPHIVWPLRFVLPHSPDLRPRWMIRAGLFLYDHLASRRMLGGSGSVRLDALGDPTLFNAQFRYGFTYWDCWVDDSRLVVLNAMAAARRGATILTRTRVEKLQPAAGRWRAGLYDEQTSTRREITARFVINAAGPWAADMLSAIGAGAPSVAQAGPRLRLVKGSHIVVPRVHELQDALILQNDDGRIVFVLPYEDDFSLIGTTDVPFDADPSCVTASEEEIAYILAAVGRYLRKPPRREDIVHTFSGVRPLYEEDAGKSASAASRDYLIHTSRFDGASPVISVLGGKITTYRQLAQSVMQELAQHCPGLAGAWTADAPLPGGDIPDADFDAFVGRLASNRPALPRTFLAALARRHGTLCDEVLGACSEVAHLGRHFGAGLYEQEVRYLVRAEWARTADDVLWRRTKFGLHLGPQQRQALADCIEELRGQA
jgi:glycerol-3-phosphate dehydrogenase